jgi:peroxiredoxin
MNREFRNIMPGELNGLPQTFVIDADGKIVYHKRKWRPGDEDKIFEAVKSI